ncbi:MAG: hypothetical protein CBC57_06725 [Euryarchaeota archaeon TMED97]|nr:MAG: hypothetical protein CBC57_06725 [Euryarchaeota archaeon TMED97]|tara:strand:- start:663 stop:2612 length:1950 start_codon:yes stop_codon:yes gene_type:complete
MNEAQKQFLESIANNQPINADLGNGEVVVKDEEPVKKQKGRSFVQGLTFGFGDEIEAAIRSAVPERFGGKTYEVIRDQIRKDLKEYQEAFPAEAISAEVIGAIAPTAVAMFTGVGGGVATTATTARTAGIGKRALDAAKVIAPQAAISSVGYSDADLLSGEMAADTGVGTSFGTAVGTGVSLLPYTASKLAGPLVNFVRNKFGTKADSAVQAELMRLVEMTGKSVDEVIEDVASGKIIADNKTLGVAIKSMVNEGGENAALILGRSGARADATRTTANQSMRDALAPEVDDPNIIRAQGQTQDALKREQSDEYKRIFAGGDELNQEGVEQLMNIIQRIPAVRANLNEIYQARNIVPLFKELDDGAIEFARKPTLQDAESVRRALQSQSKDAFSPMGGNVRGEFGELTGDMERGLRRSIDDSSPDLANVRSDYASRMAANEAFDEGKRKALTMNVDELEVMMSKMSAEGLDAFRAGAMASINNRARRLGTTLENLAQEDKQIGAALRVILPATQQGRKALDDVGIAADAISQDKFIQPRAGTSTQGLFAEAQKRGMRMSAEDAMYGLSGNLPALARIAMNNLPQLGLNEKQMSRVIEILYSESPELVEQVLKDKTMSGAVLRRISQIADNIAKLATRPASQQSSQLATGN